MFHSLTSYVYNMPCDAQNAEYHINKSILTQPPFIFWSSADHWEFNYGSKLLI